MEKKLEGSFKKIRIPSTGVKFEICDHRKNTGKNKSKAKIGLEAFELYSKDSKGKTVLSWNSCHYNKQDGQEFEEDIKLRLKVNGSKQTNFCFTLTKEGYGGKCGRQIK